MLTLIKSLFLMRILTESLHVNWIKSIYFTYAKFMFKLTCCNCKWATLLIIFTNISFKIKLSNNVLTIQVPSQFFYEWLEEHYITLLKKTIKKELGTEGRLEYSIIMENNFNNSAVTNATNFFISNYHHDKHLSNIYNAHVNIDQKFIFNKNSD